MSERLDKNVLNKSETVLGELFSVEVRNNIKQAKKVNQLSNSGAIKDDLKKRKRQYLI